MIDYWVYTGDTTYNSVTYQAMVYQTGENKDYLPGNQTLTEVRDPSLPPKWIIDHTNP